MTNERIAQGTATFTVADRAALAVLAAQLSNGGRRAVEVETCNDDGDAWAAVLTATKDGRDMLPALTVQTTKTPGERLVILGADGARVLARGDDLGALVAKLRVRRTRH